MTDTIIKGFEPPKDCVRCYGKIGQYIDSCPMRGINAEFPKPYERHRNCPIIELPSHGDLMDKSEALEKIKYWKMTTDLNGYGRVIIENSLIKEMLNYFPVVLGGNKQ